MKGKNSSFEQDIAFVNGLITEMVENLKGKTLEILPYRQLQQKIIDVADVLGVKLRKDKLVLYSHTAGNKGSYFVISVNNFKAVFPSFVGRVQFQNLNEEQKTIVAKKFMELRDFIAQLR